MKIKNSYTQFIRFRLFVHERPQQCAHRSQFIIIEIRSTSGYPGARESTTGAETFECFEQ